MKSDDKEFSTTRALPLVISLGIPALVMALPHIGYMYGFETLKNTIYSEFGIVENLTAFFLLCAVITGLRALRFRPFPKVSYLAAWITVFTLGCFYFMGEEISWGQTYFRWATPEGWQAINDQAETNLHNIAGIFDQLPRTLLSLAALGCIFIPLYLKKKNIRLDSRKIWSWVMPTTELVPVALFATIVATPGKIAKALGLAAPVSFVEGAGELKEALLALLLLMYLLSIVHRLAGGRERVRVSQGVPATSAL